MKSFVSAASVVALAHAATPVEKVVNLLTDLREKVKEDGKQEKAVYDKYACWCDKTKKRKTDAINKAIEDLKTFADEILKLESTIALRKSEIEKLEADMKENTERQADLTRIRGKENGIYSAETSDMKQTLAALEKAITVLAKATSLMQQGDKSVEATAVASLKSVLDVVPVEVAKAQQLEMLSEAVESGRYAPQSESIQGILQDMYTTFSTNLEKATRTESTKNRDFEDLMHSLSSKLAEDTATRDKKAGEKADAETLLADTNQNYHDTEAQKEADTVFLNETTASCQAKSDAWDLRSDMRREELKGIEEALKILTSDEARELFHSAIKPGMKGASFLQLKAVESKPISSAYDALKATARSTKSLRVGMLAMKVRAAKVGHFDEVIKAIDEMISNLDVEDKADIAKRDQCKEEYTKVASKTADVAWLIRVNEAKIVKLEGLTEKAEADKAATIQLIEETEDHIEEMTSQRKKENEEFEHAKKEDEDAIGLLTAAKDKLSAFYTNNEVKMGPIQGASAGLSFLQEPVFERHEDRAPDTEFSDKGSRKGASKGIISILTMIIEDLENEIKTAIKDEASAVVDYTKMLTAAQAVVKDSELKRDNLDSRIAALGEDKSDEQTLKEDNERTLGDEQEYKARIKPDCDWIIKNFNDRAKARAAEKSGLTTAKAHLAGAQ